MLTFLMVMIGGITRLTQSGLSIVDWNPIVGAVPPITDADWAAAFARYQHFPEYVELRAGMTLQEFKFIYFWEYLHRLVARTIGVVFLIPFLWFWKAGYLDHRPLRRRVLVLFALGAAQGALGWFMVMSGLVDEPRVSHYRLAAHLTVALAIFSYCVWMVRDLGVAKPAGGHASREAFTRELRWVHVTGCLLGLQILWGAFVAGLDAGYIHNTFPRMADGRFFPDGGFSMSPLLLNLTANPETVQWVHRVIGTILLLAAVAAFGTGVRRWKAREPLPGGRALRYSALFAGLVVVQYLLGVTTLLRHVPVALGVAHQSTAVLILAVWLGWLHLCRRNRSG